MQPKEPEAHVSSPLQLRAQSDPQFAEEMWRFRHPEDGGEKLTLEAILVELPARYGMEVGSLDTLSRFYRWLQVVRDARQKRDDIRQIKVELAKDPNIDPKEIEKAGRIMFLTDGIVDKNAKVFNAAYKLGQTDTSLAQRDKQLKQRDKELTQREKLVAQAERRVALLERKARALDEAAEQMRILKAGGQLMPDQERAAILDKMDEILGLKK